MASSASGQQPPKTNQHVELIISSDDHDAGTAAGRLFDEEDEAKELLLDVVDSLADDDGEGDGPPAAAAHGTGGRPPPKIRVRGLRKRAASTGEEILRGVHLDVPRGVVMGVIGPSGSGKSTLLRALNRLWEPAPGAVFLDGADVCGLDVRALRRKVGMLFQQPAMFDGTYTYVLLAVHARRLETDFVHSFLCQIAAFFFSANQDEVHEHVDRTIGDQRL
jgi:ABC-type multidrug transport system fused ATPase/permease subunit